MVRRHFLQVDSYVHLTDSCTRLALRFCPCCTFLLLRPFNTRYIRTCICRHQTCRKRLRSVSRRVLFFRVFRNSPSDFPARA